MAAFPYAVEFVRSIASVPCNQSAGAEAVRGCEPVEHGQIARRVNPEYDSTVDAVWIAASGGGTVQIAAFVPDQLSPGKSPVGASGKRIKHRLLARRVDFEKDPAAEYDFESCGSLFAADSFRAAA